MQDEACRNMHRNVADNGEPGRSDTFEIILSTGYTAAGTLAGGNIQLHVKACK